MQFSDISKQVAIWTMMMMITKMIMMMTKMIMMMTKMIMMMMKMAEMPKALGNWSVPQVAEDWRNCAESVKRTYEEKAQRFVSKTFEEDTKVFESNSKM